MPAKRAARHYLLNRPDSVPPESVSRCRGILWPLLLDAISLPQIHRASKRPLQRFKVSLLPPDCYRRQQPVTPVSVPGEECPVPSWNGAENYFTSTLAPASVNFF